MQFSVCLAALGTALVVLLLAARRLPAAETQTPWLLILPCAGIVVVIAVLEWCNADFRAAPAFGQRVLRPLCWKRVALRICGLAASLALVAVAYWVLPEYRGNFYDPYWRFLRAMAPLLWLTAPYFIWADRRQLQVRDEYLEFGLLALARWRVVDGPTVRRHVLSWCVKAFFLPLMVVYAGNEIAAMNQAWVDVDGSLPRLYEFSYHLSYTVDLLFCVVGYVTTIRLVDSQIRSVDSTVAGWVAALVCYQPFYSVIGRFYLAYDDGIFWDNWLQPWPAIRAAWGSLIILLLVVYSLSTVAFGLRFSNLTHRGIITGGPYRYTKHPAYLAKNISWWLISVPFISDQGGQAAVRNCAALLLLNLVYFARARTEERHLSADDRYVAYALWLNDHGVLRRFGQWMPWLAYRPPANTAIGKGQEAVP